MATLRRYFVAGLLVWIPLGITLWVMKLLVDAMDQSLLLLPEYLRSDALFGFHVPGLGIILTLAIVLVTGALAANFFGRKLLLLGHEILQRIPIVRSIYGGVKQISDTLFSPRGTRFAARCWCAIRTPAAGPWRSSPAPRSTKWPTSSGRTRYRCSSPPRRTSPPGSSSWSPAPTPSSST